MSQKLKFKTFQRSYRPLPAGPTSLDTTPSEALPPDLISIRFGPEKADFGSDLGHNQVQGEGFGGGRVQSRRSGWEGSVAPQKVLKLNVSGAFLKKSPPEPLRPSLRLACH